MCVTLPDPSLSMAIPWRDTFCQDMDALRLFIEEWFKTMESPRTGLSPHWWVLNTHLLIHAVDQLEDLGPVREYWMFVFESLNGKIKRWVKNNAYPVQSIMNGMGRQKTIRFIQGLLQVLRGEAPRPFTVPKVERDIVIVDRVGKWHKFSDEERRQLTKWLHSNVGHYQRLKELMEAHNATIRRR